MDELRSELRESVIAAMAGEDSNVSLSDDDSGVLRQLIDAACDAIDDCGDDVAIQNAIVEAAESRLRAAELALERLEAGQRSGG